MEVVNNLGITLPVDQNHSRKSCPETDNPHQSVTKLYLCLIYIKNTIRCGFDNHATPRIKSGRDGQQISVRTGYNLITYRFIANATAVLYRTQS